MRGLFRYFGHISIAAVFTLGPFALRGQEVSRKPIKTSVCRLASTPERFENRLIIVKSQLESDGMHGAGLIDKSCPGKGVAITFDNSSDRKSEIALHNAVFSGVPGTTDKEIEGTFIGLFHADANRIPNRVLTIRTILGLTKREKSSGSNVK